MKYLLLLVLLLAGCGNAFAGTGWECERGNGGLVYTVPCCTPQGTRFAVGSNKDYPSCPSDSDYKKCEIKAPFFSNRDTVMENIHAETEVEKVKSKEICEARGPKDKFKGYPILIAYDSCPNSYAPCIVYTSTGKFYKPKK